MRRLLLALLVLLTACGTAADTTTVGTTPPTTVEPTTVGDTTTAPSAAVAITTVPAEAPAPVDVAVRSITVGGMGARYSDPDRCIVDLGSSSRRPTVEAANQAAARAAQAMTDVLVAAGVDPADIQTSEFSINSYYDDYPVIGGYEAHFGYRVTLPDIDGVGGVLASAIDAGGDDVRAWGMRFEADITDLIGPAREAAWADAHGRAEALAGLAGEPLGELLDAHEKVLVTSSQGMMEGGEGDTAAFSVPVSPGVSGVMVLLTVTFAIGE